MEEILCPDCKHAIRNHGCGVWKDGVRCNYCRDLSMSMLKELDRLRAIEAQLRELLRIERIKVDSLENNLNRLLST